MRRNWFTGRCSLCGIRTRVRWIERGIRPELVKVCGDCEERIKDLLEAHRRPVDQIQQLPLFREHDYV